MFTTKGLKDYFGNRALIVPATPKHEAAFKALCKDYQFGMITSASYLHGDLEDESETDLFYTVHGSLKPGICSAHVLKIGPDGKGFIEPCRILTWPTGRPLLGEVTRSLVVDPKDMSGYSSALDHYKNKSHSL